MGNFPKLFEPLKVNKFTYRNRIVSAPMALAFVVQEEKAREKSYRKIEVIAKGGNGAVIVGECNINFKDANRIPFRPVDFSLRSGEDFELIKEYPRRIKKHGAVSLVELVHPGTEKIPFGPGEETIGPNDEVMPNGIKVRAMDASDMKRIADDFANAASYMKDAGFDGVLIHGGHGFLFTQFLSPLLNRRTDEYGGSFENRVRLPIEILKAIREAVGPDFIIELRLSGSDHKAGGITPEESGEFCHTLEGIVDAIHVSSGIYYEPILTQNVSSMFMEHGCNAEISATIKKYTNIPVGVVGGINSPELAEEIVATGKADYVIMARQMLADPEFANKAKDGKEAQIRRCLRCYKCFPGSPEGGYDDIPYTSKDLAQIVGQCTINPRAGIHFDPDAVEPAKTSKEVMVVGGGAAGMQAAIDLYDRGHKVTLVEKSNKLGGLLYFTDVDIDKPDLKAFKDLLVREVNLRKIQVELNTEVTPEYIKTLKPEVIILATGSLPVTPPILGIEKASQAMAVYDKSIDLGKNIIMIGGGLVGCETGLFLAKTGHNVTIVEMLPRLANDSFGMYREALIREMEKYNMVTYTKTKCLEILDKSVRIEVEGEGEKELSADTVLYALGMKSVSTTHLKEAAGDIPVYEIGDCITPGKVDSAVKTAYFTAIEI